VVATPAAALAMEMKELGDGAVSPIDSVFIV
jgi:hypothetical protein